MPSDIDIAHLAATKGWINTHSGRKFYPLAPRIEDLNIGDQTAALSKIARYGGHPRRFYPVAAHAWIMSHVIERRAVRARKTPAEACELARWALVHDNGEAYYGDIVRPLKQLDDFAFLKPLEALYHKLFAEWLGLESASEPPEVTELDLEMVAYEAPAVYDRLHPDWPLPEQRADAFEREFIRAAIDRLSDKPALVEQEYGRRFRQLFRERGL